MNPEIKASWWRRPLYYCYFLPCNVHVLYVKRTGKKGVNLAFRFLFNLQTCLESTLILETRVPACCVHVNAVCIYIKKDHIFHVNVLHTSRKKDYTSPLLSVMFVVYSLLGDNCVIVLRQFRRNFSTWGCVFHCNVCNPSSNTQSDFERHNVFMGVLIFFVFYTFCLNNKPVVTCTVWIKAIQFVTWLFLLFHGWNRMFVCFFFLQSIVNWKSVDKLSSGGQIVFAAELWYWHQ